MGPTPGCPVSLYKGGNSDMRAEGRLREGAGERPPGHAKERGLGTSRPAKTLPSDFQPPGPGENRFVLFEPPRPCSSVTAALADRTMPRWVRFTPKSLPEF